MKTKKMVALLLTLAMPVSLMLSSCDSSGKKDEINSSSPASTASEKADNAVDTSKEVTLRAYLIGDEGGPHANAALENLNTMLKEKINATVSPLMVSWGDYKQKMPLIYASGENYDMTYTSDWTGYFTEGVKGPFKDITELLPQYAPKTYAEMQSSGADKALMINDKLYMVPGSGKEYAAHFVIFREDLREKYNCAPIKDYASLEAFMDTIKEKEPEMLPMNLSGNNGYMEMLFSQEIDWGTGVEGSHGVVSYKLDDTSSFFNLVETPEYEAYAKKMHEWYKKGYWSKSVLSEKTTVRDQFYAGKSAVTIDNSSNVNTIYKKISNEQKDWKVDFVSLDTNKILRVSPGNNGMAIGVNSPNPERSLMFLELAHQDEEIYNALVYGIKGTTYELTEDNKIKLPDGVAPGEVGLKNFGMAIPDVKFKKSSLDDYAKIVDLETSMFETSIVPALAGFFLNQDTISAELAAIKSVCAEYKTPIDFGIIDPVEGLPILNQKLKEAGLDKVMEEANKQLTEFKAARGIK